MNLWYVNHYARAPVRGAYGRPLHLGRELTRLGQNVLIVAASTHHLRPTPVARADVGRPIETPSGTFLFLPARPYRGNGLGRTLNMADFARGLAGLAGRVTRGELPRPDVIIASSAHLLVFPPARALARKLGAKLVFEVRDIWPQSLIDVAGVPAWHPLVLWFARIERDAYRTADAVVSLLPSALAHMQPLGLSPERFHWIPNGVCAEEWTDPPPPLPEPHRLAIEACRASGRLVVLYAGAHGPPNALDQVLDLARTGDLGGRPYQFLLVGDGILKPALQSRCAREGIDFITFLPTVSHLEARSVIDEADVCFLGWQDRPIYRCGISANKLFEYMMAGKPVLHAFGGAGDPVTAARAGICVPPYAPAALDDALRRLAALAPAERLAMGSRGRAHVLQDFEWTVLGRRYLELCGSLAGNPARPGA